MAVVLHHKPDHGEGRDGDPPYPVAIVKAIVTVVLVTAVVAAALGGVAYLAARVLVSMMPT